MDIYHTLPSPPNDKTERQITCQTLALVFPYEEQYIPKSAYHVNIPIFQYLPIISVAMLFKVRCGPNDGMCIYIVSVTNGNNNTVFKWLQTIGRYTSRWMFLFLQTNTSEMPHVDCSTVTNVRYICDWLRYYWEWYKHKECICKGYNHHEVSANVLPWQSRITATYQHSHDQSPV